MSSSNLSIGLKARLLCASMTALAGAWALPAYAQDTAEDGAAVAGEQKDAIVVTGSRIAGVAPVGATVTTLGERRSKPLGR